jgi:hypothetical protein
MKNSTDQGFDQHYNAQVAVDQASLLIVGTSRSNHANDQAEVAPTVEATPPALGTPEAAALDTGYFSEANIGEEVYTHHALKRFKFGVVSQGDA